MRPLQVIGMTVVSGLGGLGRCSDQWPLPRGEGAGNGTRCAVTDWVR